jgi:putative oxidoreductase
MNVAAPSWILANTMLLASRLLLASIFVHEGAFLIANFAAASAALAKSDVPAPALMAPIVLQLIAGTAIAIGWHVRSAAAALGVFCMSTAALFHNNFANRNELLQFEKDLAIAGGMFVLRLRGAGLYSLDAYPGRGVRRDKPVLLANREIAADPQSSYDPALISAGIASPATAPDPMVGTMGT